MDFNPDARPDDAPLVDTAAARRVHDDLLASKPEGASHNADICQFCVADKAAQGSAVPEPSRSDAAGTPDNQPAAIEHGGRDTTPMSDTISKETHEALVAAKVAEATSVTEKALETKTTEAQDLASKVDSLEAEKATLQKEVDRLNSELDTAQVAQKAATEKAEQLEKDIAAERDKATKAELASKRADQVKNLGLYPDEYVQERASKWAEMAEEDWAERLDEWSKLAKPADATKTTDKPSDSAMSGTSGNLTEDPKSTDTAGATTKPSSRRAVLGLS